MTTPPLFHVGQLVTPVENCDWMPFPGCEHLPIPVIGKVYEVRKVGASIDIPRWFIGLVELTSYGVMYREDCFVAVESISSEAIAELVADALAPVLA